MDLLKRELAPITSEAWQQIDEEAKRVLELHLAGRKLVDFSGPHGWKLGARQHRSARSGSRRIRSRTSVTAIRDVQPLVELRSPIVLPIMELDYAARGANDLDLDAVIDTAERVAHAEDAAIFHGFKEGRIKGIIAASPHKPIDVNVDARLAARDRPKRRRRCASPASTVRTRSPPASRPTTS